MTKLIECFLICFLIFVLSGCSENKKLDDTVDQMGGISMSSLLYYGHNNCWPNSVDELKSFCSENQSDCFPLDWDKYNDTEFEILSDESLRIKMSATEDANKSTEIVTTLSKPKFQKD